MSPANFPSHGIKSSFFSSQNAVNQLVNVESTSSPDLKVAFHSQALQAISKMQSTECGIFHLKNNNQDAKDDKENCLKARKSTVNTSTLLKLKFFSKSTPTLLLITPMSTRGHIAGYGDISFILQHLPPPCNRTLSPVPLHTMGVFPAAWDELDVRTYSFPKPGHQPVIWVVFKHHFDTIGTYEIMQCRKMGSQDKISNSFSSLPASKKKMGHRSGQTHALARPALTWGCLRLP